MHDRAPLRVGLIGYGLAGEAFHAPLIAATPGLELAAVVTSDPDRAARARRRYPGVRLHPSADGLWDDADALDLVVVASPNRTHVPLARAAIDAGLAVVVDKPLAATSAEGEALAREAERRGVLLSVFQNRRWDGDFLTLRALLDRGELGTVHRFESRFDRWRPQPKAGWRESSDPADAGGTLYDLGSHLIDQARVLFGPVASVYAEVDRRRADVQADDDVFLALTHRSGVRSHLWSSALAGEHTLRMRVLGSAGAYVKRGMDVQEAALRAGEAPDSPGFGVEPQSAWGQLAAGDERRPVPTERGAYTAFYAGMEAALREGGPPPVDARDAVAVLCVIEAAQASAAERRVVEVGDG
jgi:scyllo-inositol 2-dehydrogenase (NADP+)